MGYYTWLQNKIWCSMSLLGNLFTIIPFIKNKKKCNLRHYCHCHREHEHPPPLPPLLNNALHFWRGRTSLNKDRLGTTKFLIWKKHEKARSFVRHFAFVFENVKHLWICGWYLVRVKISWSNFVFLPLSRVFLCWSRNWNSEMLWKYWLVGAREVLMMARGGWWGKNISQWRNIGWQRSGGLAQ